MIPVELKKKRWYGIEKTYKGSVPEKWSELNHKQFVAIASIIRTQQFNFKPLQAITGINKSLLEQLDNVELYHLIEQLNWINEAAPMNRFIIKSVGKYVTPADMYENVSWGRFIYIDTYLCDYIENQKNETLNLLCSHLFFSKKNKTEPFNHNLSCERAISRLITSIDINERYALMINSLMLREWLAIKFPLIFPKPKPGQEKTADDEKRAGKTQNPWIKMHNAIVGDNIADYERYAELPCLVVLRYITQKIKENAKKRS